jgi:uncharacterized membrane protein YgcG
MMDSETKILFSSLKGITTMRRLSSQFIYTGALVFLVLAAMSSPLFAQESPAVDVAVQGAKEAGVPEKEINHILVLGYNHHLRSEEVTALMSITREARTENLPVHPLISKMEEGLAKGVKVQVIEQVVRQELSQYRFVRTLASRAMDRWEVPVKGLNDSDLVRLAKTLTMGISEQEMKGFFEEAPPTSMKAFVNAFEFMAALKQAGLSAEVTKAVAFVGLEKGYFSKSALNLASTIHAAKRGNIAEHEIERAALEVVLGNSSVQETQRALGLEPKDLDRGPHVSSSHGEGAPSTKGDRGESGAGGHGGGAGSAGGGDMGGGDMGGGDGGGCGGGMGGGHR